MRVRATTSGIVRLDDVRYVVKEGADYDIDDPIVTANQWMFERIGGAVVEQATATPGEKRATKRG